MLWKKLKYCKYKQPHEACATLVAVNDCIILTMIYYKLPFYLQLITMFLVGLPLAYLIYYLLLSLFKIKGEIHPPPLTYHNLKNNSLSQNLVICRQAFQNKTMWCVMASSGIAFVISWGALIFQAPLIDQVGIWIPLLLINIVQVTVTFLLFDAFKKLFKISK